MWYKTDPDKICKKQLNNQFFKCVFLQYYCGLFWQLKHDLLSNARSLFFVCPFSEVNHPLSLAKEWVLKCNSSIIQMKLIEGFLLC